MKIVKSVLLILLCASFHLLLFSTTQAKTNFKEAPNCVLYVIKCSDVLEQDNLVFSTNRSLSMLGFFRVSTPTQNRANKLQNPFTKLQFAGEPTMSKNNYISKAHKTTLFSGNPLSLLNSANSSTLPHKKIIDENDVIEVEIRYIVKDSKKLKKFLDKQKLLSTKKEIDIYYDTPTASLFTKGVFIRLRNETQLNFKFNESDFKQNSKSGEHTHCNEYTFQIPLLEQDRQRLNDLLIFLGLKQGKDYNFEAFLSLNNFKPSVFIIKTRKTYEGGKFTLCWDEIENLGSFLEVEFLAKKGENLDSIKKELREFIPQNIGLSELTTGYVALYWRKKDFEVYKKGKYHTKEDKKLFEIESLKRV